MKTQRNEVESGVGREDSEKMIGNEIFVASRDTPKKKKMNKRASEQPKKKDCMKGWEWVSAMQTQHSSKSFVRECDRAAKCAPEL